MKLRKYDEYEESSMEETTINEGIVAKQLADTA